MGSYTKKNITSGDLDNQSTHQLEDAQDSRESQDEDPDMNETLLPEQQGDPDSTIEDMYNQFYIEEDDCWFYEIVDRYFNNVVILLKGGYVGDTLGKDNIIEVPFIILKKDLPIELVRYVNNCVVEASRQKVLYNSWSTKVLKGQTRAVKNLYRMK